MAKNGQNGKKYSNSKQNQLTFHMVRFSFGIIWGQLVDLKDQHSQGHGTQMGPSEAQKNSWNLVAT